ncbi:MAG: DUF192 domain-containing protein [Alphaproteobacteria bacterium]|nr:DUF192 domain-containing protein [Alphaproteobacteria bacterium]
MRLCYLVGVGLVLGVLLGCSSFAAQGQPQAPLPRSALVIDTSHGPVRFTVELAADTRAQELGLMYRRHMAADAGMLFDFHRPQPVTFWMKNTILPLDMIFIRDDGTISTVRADAVPYSEALIPSAEPVRAVLEINGGQAAALGIAPGERVHHAIFGDAPAP